MAFELFHLRDQMPGRDCIFLYLLIYAETAANLLFIAWPLDSMCNIVPTDILPANTLWGLACGSVLPLAMIASQIPANVSTALHSCGMDVSVIGVTINAHLH